MFLDKKGSLRAKTKTCDSISIFVNDGDPYNSCQPPSKFLVGNGCVKGRKKSKEMLLIRLLKFGDLRRSNNSFEFFRIHI